MMLMMMTMMVFLATLTHEHTHTRRQLLFQRCANTCSSCSLLSHAHTHIYFVPPSVMCVCKGKKTVFDFKQPQLFSPSFAYFTLPFIQMFFISAPRTRCIIVCMCVW